MASSSMSPELDFHQLMECPVCLVKYCLPERTPKNLRCGHTFCLSCLTKLVYGSTVTCPTCRAETNVPADGTKGLMSNHAVTGMLETLCSGCGDKFKQGQCAHCDKFLCRDCLDNHVSNLATENQQLLIAISTIIKEKSSAKQTDIETKAVHEQFAVRRTEIRNSIAAENRDFLDAQHKKEEELMTDLDNEQQQKMREIITRVQLQHHDIVQWTVTKETLSRQLSNDDLTNKQLLDINKAATDLEMRIKGGFQSLLQKPSVCEVNVVDHEVFHDRHFGPASTLAYYRRINQPEYTYNSSPSVGKAGFMNATYCPKNNVIYVADLVGSCITKLDDTGQHLMNIGAEQITPRGIATKKNGEVIISSITYLMKYSSVGKVIKSLQKKNFKTLRAITYGADDALYVVDSEASMVHLITTNGEYKIHSVFTEEIRSIVEYPGGIILVGTAEIYPKIWKIYPDGSKHKMVIHLDSTTRYEDLGFYDMCVDKDGLIIIADWGGNSILVVDIDGSVQCRIGVSGSLPGQFNQPSGVCLTGDGRLVVAENGNKRIQIF